MKEIDCSTWNKITQTKLAELKNQDYNDFTNIQHRGQVFLYRGTKQQKNVRFIKIYCAPLYWKA